MGTKVGHPKATSRRGRKPKGEITIKNRKFLKLVVEGMSPPDAYQKLYPDAAPATARRKGYQLMQKLKEKQSYIEAMDAAGLTDEALAKKHFELLHAKKVVTASFEGRITDEKEYDDPQTQMAALKHANTLKGHVPNTKTEITGANGGPIEATVILVDKDEESDHD